MNASFLSIFNQLERQRADVFDRVKNLPADQFNYSSAKDTWSIAQILTHVLVAEQMSLQYMKKKALGIEKLKNSGLGATIRLSILVISQRIPAIKYKAPKLVVDHTPPAFELPELIKQWEIHRHDLKKFLDSISDGNSKKMIYKHLIAGRFDARQGMIFSREHMNHHLPQIQRLLNQNS